MLPLNRKIDRDKVASSWQVNDRAFVIACPSSKGGVYLVGIATTEDGRLVIAHECPAIKTGYECWHIDAAIQAYKEWFWWKEIPEEVVKVQRKIVLSPKWVQIPVWREQAKKEVVG